MKKITKILIAAFAALFVSSAAFADDFDWSQCWCNYGAGIEEGDVIIDAGVGLGSGVVSLALNKGWFIPPAEVSLEVPVKLGPCPFSFGGAFTYDANGWRDSYTDEVYFSHNMYIAGMAKYHFMFPPKNLDLYAGLKAGVNLYISESGFHFNPIPYLSEIIGASWYFSDSFGVNLEFGNPIWARAGVSLKF